MKKILPLLVFMFLGLTNLAFATHTLGGEIYYNQLSPNTYQVSFKQYRYCSGQQPATTTTLLVQAPGCNSGRAITLNQVSQKLINPYGSTIAVNCSSGFVEVVTFSGTLTFNSAELTCPDWVISWTDCCRGSTANLIGQDQFYTEAKLKLMPGVINNSPSFDTLHAPIMYVNYGMYNNLSMMAVDSDGDSLVYTLEAPLAQANTPVPYKPNPFPGIQGPLPTNMIVNPNPRPPFANPFNPQLALITNGPVPTTYTATYPIPTLYVNWNAAPTIPYPNVSPNGLIWEAKYLFELNPVHGELKFVALAYSPHAIMGDNMYTVAFKVEEYRKVNGVITKLGSVRRESMIFVENVMNANPELAGQQANNQPIAPGHEIRLRPGTPLSLNFAGGDLDTNMVILSTNATTILPGSSFVSTSGTGPTGSITWVPTAADVRWQPYFFQVKFRDDANPLRGVHTETYMVRVSHTGGVTSTAEAFEKGNFSAYPNPFSQELNFRLDFQTKAESIEIYNLLGQQVDKISLQKTGLGQENVKWNNAANHAAGTYVAKLLFENKAVKTPKFTKLQ